MRPSLKTSVSTYHTVVGVSESSVTITATANDTQSADSIFVNGTRRASGTPFSETVAHGATTFEIVVVAGDGVTTRTYHLTVTRAVDDTVTNATLALLDLTFDDGTTLNSTQMGGAPWPRCVKGECDANSRAVLRRQPGLHHRLDRHRIHRAHPRARRQGDHHRHPDAFRRVRSSVHAR